MKISTLLHRFFLAGLLLLPTIISHAHTLLNHDHTACDTNNIHFHEVDQNCDLVDYLSFNSYLSIKNIKITSDFIELVFLTSTTKKYSSSNYAKFQRGPPVK